MSIPKLRGGVGHMYLPQDKIFGEIHRCLITSQFLTPPDERFGEITITPTWQNFPHTTEPGYGDFDAYLTALKGRGVKVMANLLNGFNKKYALPLKALPKNAPGLSSDQVENFSLFRKILEQFVLRYGKVKDDSKIDIADFSLNWGGNPQGAQPKVSGLDLIWSVQILNELNNTWVKPDEEGRLSGAQYAHLLKYLSDGIWSIDPSMPIVAQCTAGWHINYWQEFFTTWETSYGAFPNFNPDTGTGIAISFNQYLLGGCGVWGKCRVKDAQTEITRIGKEANDFLKSKGAYALVTEHGCATEINSDLGYPDYPGLDKYQSQAKFLIDSTNLWLGFSNIIGVTFYQYVDDPNEPRFQYTGLIEHRTGNKKPSYDIVKEAFSKPIPEPPTPPMRHPKKQGSTLVWSDTGERIILAELNSPETLLRQSLADFKAIIDYAVSVKLNGCYCTLYAGDKYSSTLHPYNGTKQVNGKTFGDPATGFNEATMQDWKTKLEYAASKGMILHLLLSEKENHFIRTDAQEKEFIDKMVATFGHMPIIWDREEFPLGKDNWIQVYFDYLANADPNNVIAIHNNTGEKPWIGHAGRIHLLSIQADVNSMDSIIKTQTAAGFAVYSSEGTGTHAVGDTTRAAKLRDAGGNLSSGAGIYIAPLDQDATLAQLKQYDSVFTTLSGTTTPNPNPTTMKIGYSTKSDRSDFKELVSGANLPTGNIYIEAREATPPVVFQLYKEGLSIKQQTENAAPYDSHGGQPFNATAGSYELQVKDKNTPSVGIAFTVGTVTPPPNEVKGTTFVKTVEGKVKFNFEDGSAIIF